jgi:hypothetical protein
VVWEIDNVSPCIAEPVPELGYPALIYSTWLGSGDAPECDAYDEFPQPVPARPWSSQRVVAPAPGSARLCVSLRHGEADRPTDDDCVVFESCQDVDYKGSGEVDELAPLAGWSGEDGACNDAYYEDGGYLEVRVESSDYGCTAGDSVIRRQLCPRDCAPGDQSERCARCGDPSLVGQF